MSHLAFPVPWVVSQTTPEEKAGLLATAALPMKVLWYASRGRYDRLATRALGGPVATPVAAAA
jgi:hypothetical protein